ncbi:MAG TPA: 30S ribosomal protein S3 [Candidatus Peregrinibacteria bacterium]|nr:30S ribosomal protein S3 [Candidatus Peregrinibacteria bacterium]
MGQKVNPISARIGIIFTWPSAWYADKKNYADYLQRDIALRKEVKSALKGAGFSKIGIQRSNKKVVINIHTSKPGVIIGRQGANIEKLRESLGKKFRDQIEINILEIKKPDLDAAVLAKEVAMQLERRIAFRRASKQAIRRAMEAGAKGVKVSVAGRLNGVEIARTETFKDGSIPLHTFRADIDYANDIARTTYGAIGVKVWVYRGEIFKDKKEVI